MDKITFTFSDTEETVEFFVVEQTKFQGQQYLLVADSSYTASSSSGTDKSLKI